MDITGAVALVTGANRGLGRRFAAALLERGAAKVYAAARNPESIDLPGVVPLKLDVTRVPVQVTDSEGRTKSVDVRLVVAKRLTFSKVRLKAARAGVAYRAKLRLVGGAAPLTRTSRGKVPRGLKVTKTGLLLGTPTAAGTYRFTVTAVDALRASARTSAARAIGQAGPSQGVRRLIGVIPPT
jgi:NAD(P)-dependent dehydrogenase (short-subunit alcohol dehydrogenase family)